MIRSKRRVEGGFRFDFEMRFCRALDGPGESQKLGISRGDLVDRTLRCGAVLDAEESPCFGNALVNGDSDDAVGYQRHFTIGIFGSGNDYLVAADKLLILPDDRANDLGALRV